MLGLALLGDVVRELHDTVATDSTAAADLRRRADAFFADLEARFAPRTRPAKQSATQTTDEAVA